MISKSYYRLIPLWILAENFLYGLLHAFRILLTGVSIVCFLALFIMLMYSTTGSSTKVIHAILIALIFKMLLIPRALLEAFLSVALQTSSGVLILRLIPSQQIGRMLMTVFAYMQSAIIKLISLTIIFGMDLWDATDEFKLLPVDCFLFFAIALSTKNLVISHVGIYLVTGIIASWMIGKVVLSFKRNLLVLRPEPGANTQKKNRNFGRVFIAVLAVIYFIPPIPASFREMTLIAAIILTAWTLILDPLAVKALFAFLGSRKFGLPRETNLIEEILPEMRKNLKISWRAASGQKTVKLIYSL